jgi:rfaE bifunctional protein nucleotidyltransferase chain/domain
MIPVLYKDEISKNFLPENKKIVFTNGCFDIIHTGHIDYLEKAKNFGDYLVVGLNSDNSVKSIKGNTRPVNNELDRAKVLSALRPVDVVVIFNEQTPVQLIKIVNPDIHVKGGDYKADDLPEKNVLDEIGAKIEIIPYLEGYSTTKIINKIKQTYS